MEYYEILNLTREPFSSSPDPEFFYESRQHLGCLQQLELSLRMRRGLNVILGEVGTGKTTLCRQIIRKFSADDKIETHLILDPHFSSDSEFLSVFSNMLTGVKPPDDANNWQIKETIKQQIFKKGIDEDKIVVLIIDEAQKTPVFCLELLRELLNYETNDRKLLQIVLFAQREFQATLDRHPNFSDRISLYHSLTPLDFHDTRLMIQYRINQSSTMAKEFSFFSRPSLWMIYRATKGYPRKIVTLCHQAILAMIIQNRSKVSYRLVRSCVNRVFSKKTGSWSGVTASALMLILALVLATIVLSPRMLLIDTALIFPEVSSSENAQMRSAALVTAKIKTPDLPQPNVTSIPLNDTPVGEIDNATEAATEEKTETTLPTETSEPDIAESDLYVYPPITLGRVAIHRQETLGELIQIIYGEVQPYLKTIISSNPHIKDPNNLAIGEKIDFPAIAVPIEPVMNNWHWIVIDKKESLPEALSVIRSYPKKNRTIGSIPLRLIPAWSQREGFIISVIFRQIYDDEQSAREQLLRLPSALAAEGSIVTEWDQEAVYYANPFLIGNR